jgi:hypothetical protein
MVRNPRPSGAPGTRGIGLDRKANDRLSPRALTTWMAGRHVCIPRYRRDRPAHAFPSREAHRPSPRGPLASSAFLPARHHPLGTPHRPAHHRPNEQLTTRGHSDDLSEASARLSPGRPQRPVRSESTRDLRAAQPRPHQNSRLKHEPNPREFSQRQTVRRRLTLAPSHRSAASRPRRGPRPRLPS